MRPWTKDPDAPERGDAEVLTEVEGVRVQLAEAVEEDRGLDVLLLQAAAAAKTPDSSLWNREFSSLHVIPSSVSTTPSRALRVLMSRLPPPPARVLDVGCGNGRNAVCLALAGYSVVAIDISEQALHSARALASAHGVQARIEYRLTPWEQLATDRAPFEIVLDSYVSCHELEPIRRRALKAMLRQVMDPQRGVLLTFGPSPNDQYYRPLVIIGGEHAAIAVDGKNAIPKLLLSPAGLYSAWRSSASSPVVGELSFQDDVSGEAFVKATSFLLVGAQLRL